MPNVVDKVNFRGTEIEFRDNTKAPISHASTDTGYGPATGTNYGHVKLSDSISDSSSNTSSSTAATPKAVYDSMISAENLDHASGTLSVGHGGLGISNPTSHGVLVGQGTATVSPVGATSTGAFYKDVTNADPKFATLPVSMGGTGVTRVSSGDVLVGNSSNGFSIKSESSLSVSYASTAGGLDASHISGIIGVGNGGTGRDTLTVHGVLVGNGTSGVNSIANGAGALFASSSGVDPEFGTLGVQYGGTGTDSIAANNVVIGNGSNTVSLVPPQSGALFATGTNTTPTFGTLSVAQGGTGRTSLTDGEILIGSGTGGITSVATLPISKGGTNITTNPQMVVNLSSTAAADVFTASPSPGVTGTLPVGNGGTGVDTFTSGYLLVGNGANGISTISASQLTVSSAAYASSAGTASTAASATQLQTARRLQVDLSSSNAPTFNGTDDVLNIGVSNTLGATNGGTGIDNFITSVAPLHISSPASTPDNNGALHLNATTFNQNDFDRVESIMYLQLDSITNTYKSVGGESVASCRYHQKLIDNFPITGAVGRLRTYWCMGFIWVEAFVSYNSSTLSSTYEGSIKTVYIDRRNGYISTDTQPSDSTYTSIQVQYKVTRESGGPFVPHAYILLEDDPNRVDYIPKVRTWSDRCIIFNTNFDTDRDHIPSGNDSQFSYDSSLTARYDPYTSHVE